MESKRRHKKSCVSSNIIPPRPDRNGKILGAEGGGGGGEGGVDTFGYW